VVKLQIRQFGERNTSTVIQLANDHALFDGPISEDDLNITHAFPEGFIVAEEEHKIVGFAFGYFGEIPTAVSETWGVSKVATIDLLVVNPKYGKQGISTLLLKTLIDVFKQSGTDIIGLTCPVKAEQARHLYEKLGFEISAYHMRKRLD
jgi:GNAT superfamily N-acetyltransferase